LIRLLRHLHLKLDRVPARVSTKPNRRRNKVCVLGLANASGWVSGPVLDADSGKSLDLGKDPGMVTGKDSGTGLDLGSNPDLASIYLPLEPSSALAMLPELSSVPTLVSDAGLELLDVGNLGEIFGPADEVSLSASLLSAWNSSLAMVACNDPILLRHWFDSQARLGATLLSDSRLASNLVILEAYSLSWEYDLSASLGNRDWEASDFGVADSIDLPVSEVTLAKVVCGSTQAKFAWNSSPAKSLIIRGFLGPRAAPTVLDDFLPTSASALIRRGFLGSCLAPPA
jgi:hypothetical protein